MKIKKLAIIILMTTFFIILGTKVYATTGTINGKTVDLKKQPDSKTILDYLNKGDEVEILEQEDGWYKVKVQTEQGKVTGYVSEKYIDVENNADTETTEEKTENSQTTETNSTDVSVQTPEISISTNIEEDKKYILAKEVSVKAVPLINSREKAKLTGNVTILEIINDWAKVENDTESGWIRKNILKNSLANVETPTQEQPKETEQTSNTTTDEPATDVATTKPEETTTELNKTGYVSADGLRVRKEPTTDSEEIDSLSKNDKVKIIGQTGNWYKIELDGKIGYVSAKYISDTKLPEATSRSGSTLKNATTTQETTAQEEETKTEQQPAETAPVESTDTTSSTTETPATSKTTGEEVVEYAKKYLGYKYVSGGASPSTGFDCSGFTTYVYKHFGISLARTSSAQNKNGVAVEKSDLKPGDLVIFNNDANTSIGHVGIYIGEGNFIHASNPKDGVKITTLTTGYYQKRYVGARRVI